MRAKLARALSSYANIKVRKMDRVLCVCVCCVCMCCVCACVLCVCVCDSEFLKEDRHSRLFKRIEVKCGSAQYVCGGAIVHVYVHACVYALELCGIRIESPPNGTIHCV